MDPSGEIAKQCVIAMNQIKDHMKTKDSHVKSALFDLMIYYRNMHQVAALAAIAEVELRARGINLGTPPEPLIRTKRRLKRLAVSHNREHSPSANGVVTIPIKELTELTNPGGTPRFVLNISSSGVLNTLSQSTGND